MSHDAAFVKNGVPESLRAILLSAFSVFREENESRCDVGAERVVGDWSLGGDEYYDFLESWSIGHKRLRPWLRELRAGADVTLTANGVALFSALQASGGEKP